MVLIIYIFFIFNLFYSFYLKMSNNQFDKINITTIQEAIDDSVPSFENSRENVVKV